MPRSSHITKTPFLIQQVKQRIYLNLILWSQFWFHFGFFLLQFRLFYGFNGAIVKHDWAIGKG